MSLKNIVNRLKSMNSQNICFGMSSPVEDWHEEQRKIFLRGMSKYALNLYERNKDIKTFTKLAMSDPEDKSHEKMVADLVKDGKILDTTDTDKIFDLSSNEKLYDDLGI